ncbi:hypothetical protein QUB10_07880 [Microcoleus sp. B5-D4]|uniref:hypothetical protein n=1 Tax=unclassified Microcoleus TaxID=2642155 RepID=UPI002FCF07AB
MKKPKNSENSGNNVSGLPLIDPLDYAARLIFDEAIREKWSLHQFAIKILANCAGGEPVYMLVASTLIQKATNLSGEENYALLQQFIVAVYQKNSQGIRYGVQTLQDGLAVNEAQGKQN